MDAVISLVVKGEMGYFKAASQFRIPQTSLER